MNRYARIDDKEKLRMAKNLLKSNNKKIKEALRVIDAISPECKIDVTKLLKDIKLIREVLR